MLAPIIVDEELLLLCKLSAFLRSRLCNIAQSHALEREENRPI